MGKRIGDMMLNEFDAECQKLADSLDTYPELAFMCKELGFPIYTEIHNSAKKIAAKYIARIVLLHGASRGLVIDSD